MRKNVPVIVIVGGGFGGLAAARALKHAPARVYLIDRNNHHLFQPLLYQVATSVLATGQIASPIRGILRNHANTTVLMGEVTGVNTDDRHVLVSSADRENVPIPYDYLILAPGSTHNYFGHNEFEKHAPGLKNLTDAAMIRNKILSAFEQAETEEDPGRHRDLLTFVLVGAGPTGVELAGAIAGLIRSTVKAEFRRIDPSLARIVLVDREPRVLAAFSESLSRATSEHLAGMGVEVRLGQGVEHIDEDGVIVAGERISSRTVIWTAGVTPSPAGQWLKTETDRRGRVIVGQDLSVPGHPEIFVAGDTAVFDQDGKPLPGVAQVAIQQGRYAAKLVHRRITGKSNPPPFRYFDKGNMAVVGKGFAVLQSGGVHISGVVAWFAWALVHLQFLAQSGLRLSVFLQWVWTYFTGQRGSRLIVREPASHPAGDPAQVRGLVQTSR